MIVCSLLFMLWDYQRLQRLIYLFNICCSEIIIYRDWADEQENYNLPLKCIRLWRLLFYLHLDLCLVNFPNTRWRDVSVILASIACSGVQIRIVANLYYKENNTTTLNPTQQNSSCVSRPWLYSVLSQFCQGFRISTNKTAPDTQRLKSGNCAIVCMIWAHIYQSAGKRTQSMQK